MQRGHLLLPSAVNAPEIRISLRMRQPECALGPPSPPRFGSDTHVCLAQSPKVNLLPNFVREVAASAGQLGWQEQQVLQRTEQILQSKDPTPAGSTANCVCHRAVKHVS